MGEQFTYQVGFTSPIRHESYLGWHIGDTVGHSDHALESARQWVRDADTPFRKMTAGEDLRQREAARGIITAIWENPAGYYADVKWNNGNESKTMFHLLKNHTTKG